MNMTRRYTKYTMDGRKHIGHSRVFDGKRYVLAEGDVTNKLEATRIKDRLRSLGYRVRIVARKYKYDVYKRKK